MDMSLERDGGVIGTLFQQIINDMKVSAFAVFTLSLRHFVGRKREETKQTCRPVVAFDAWADAVPLRD